MSYLDDLDPTPAEYDDPRPQWLASEARRIRRERYAAMAEAVLIGVCIGVGVALVLTVLQVI